MIKSDTGASTIMSMISRSPETYSTPMLKQELGWAFTTVYKGLNVLKHHKWIEGVDAEYVIGSSRAVRVRQTSRFVEDMDILTKSLVKNHDEEQSRLYREAIDFHREARAETNLPMRNNADAASLGRLVLLNEQVEFEPFTWFDGLAAWRSLVEIHTHLEDTGQIELSHS